MAALSALTVSSSDCHDSRSRRRVGAASAERLRAPLPPQRRRDRRSAATPRVRGHRAALAPSPPAAGTPAGAAPVSFEDDQDLALLDHLALLHTHLFDGAGARRRDGDLHLHRLEDEQLIFLGDLRSGLGLHLPHAADQLRLDFSHTGMLPCLRHGRSIFLSRACSMALTITRRVSAGSMTSSIIAQPAARYGLIWARIVSINCARVASGLSEASTCLLKMMLTAPSGPMTEISANGQATMVSGS